MDSSDEKDEGDSMKYFIITIMLIFLITGCTVQKQQDVQEDVVVAQQSEISEYTDEEILAEFDDDLDAALEELDLID